MHKHALHKALAVLMRAALLNVKHNIVYDRVSFVGFSC